MRNKIWSICLAACYFHPTFLNAQAQQPVVQMADGLRSEGKIYVVVAVLLTILLGLFLYLYRLDRKISDLENKG